MAQNSKKDASFQGLILTLQNFWASQGCAILQPYDMEVGAGTSHPATLLRALGPKPWRAAYVQPSRRPKDGRYGENPNRLQHYYQFQVILKPSPDNIQELYLQSLEALGINLSEHDIRFVEDDWENPTLGAWGLGWEVWCDGMEVTQFTYFQQVGGFECAPVSGEITYGLERLAMYVQEIENVYDLVWVGESRESRVEEEERSLGSNRSTLVTYKDIFLENEREFSAYNLEFADTDILFRHFADAEKECAALLDRKLPLPAYDQCLKGVTQLQFARCAGRYWRDRARELHWPGAGFGERLLRGVAGEIRNRKSEAGKGGHMMLTMFKSKIHRATVTACELGYMGSITIDPVLLEASGILPYEQVDVLNINNGARFTTYTIPAKERGKGTITINGAAARLAQRGDLVIICAFAQMSPEEAAAFAPTIVHVDSANGIKNA